MGDVTLPMQGACLCGQVEVTVTTPPLVTFACHCRDCQKLSASAFSLTAIFASEGVEVRGRVERGGLKGPVKQHYFCPECKNFIFSKIAGAEERVNLRVSVLDDLSWFAPFAETMAEEKLPWAHVPVERSYARYPETLEELQALMADYAAQ